MYYNNNNTLTITLQWGPTNQSKLVFLPVLPVLPPLSVDAVCLTCGAVFWQVYSETGWIEDRWVVVYVKDGDSEWNSAV